MKNSSADHRVRVTRELIRKAFMTLLEEKPIDGITIKALCEQAGINRGTFYAHYQDIYDLLEQLEAELLAALTEALSPILQDADSEHSLVNICTSIFQCLKDNADMCQVMLGDHGDAKFIARLLLLGKETCLTAYSHYFQGASTAMLEYFYAFVSEGCIGLLCHWLREGMLTPAADIARMAEAIMLHGIGFLSK